MSTPTFGSSAQATQAGITVFEEAISAAKSIDTEIEAQASQLATAWTGDAATVYQMAVGAWREGYGEVVQQLNYMVEALQGTVQTVAKVEAENTDGIKQMLAKLHPVP
jgi:WXG100 family type VII secretion target